MKRSLYLVVIILLLAIVAGCSPASTAQESAPEGGFNRDFGAPAPAQPAMEAPMAPANEAMKRWVLALKKT